MTATQPDLVISEELIRRFDTLGPRYTSYPTADRFHTDFGAQDAVRHFEQRSGRRQNPPLSVYVHLPFCESLCYFCACNKIITKDHDKVGDYLQHLDREMALVAAHLGPQRDTVQLHLGGGTPTFLSGSELARLMQMLRSHFEFTPDAELGVEIDPRTVNPDTLALLADLGFNRTSFGVQDFDAGVQQAVNRVQPRALVETAIAASRRAGFESINADLIYGLPRQTLASFDRTLDQLIELAPDRIALYNYAHLPSRFKGQGLIRAAELPSAEARLQIFLLSMQRLLDAGYRYIGLDHFARPGDELSRARDNGTLHRNFQGYTTRAECDLVAFGMSSISQVGTSYSQSSHSINGYYRHLDEGRLPTEKGCELSPDDLVRRQVIMALMCGGPVRFAAINQRHGIDFVEYFKDELARLAPYQEAGLIEVDAHGIVVSAKGRLFVRGFGMVFDRYLRQPSASSYSKLI